MSKNNAKILALTASLLALIVEELNASGTEAPATAPTKPAAKKAAPAPEPADEPAEEPAADEPAEEPAADEPTIDLAALREVASTLLTDGRKPEVVKVLAKYKVGALKDLAPKHYAAVHAALTALTEA